MVQAMVGMLSFYGLVAFVGGVIGFVKAKSKASLIAGIVSGLLLGTASGLVSSGFVRLGGGLGAVIAVALIGRFLPAFMKTKKFMPAGLVAMLGMVVVCLCMAGIFTV